MISKVAVVALAAIGLSGCATIVQGSKQTMSVNTAPVDGAKCELKNSQGTWYMTTPGSVEVHKTKTDLEISCSKDGTGSGKALAKAKFGGTTFGNVLAGGLVGVAVDAASGANYYYESPVTVTLTADGAPVATPTASTDTTKAADGSKPADVAKTAEAAKTVDTAKPADAVAKPADTVKPTEKPTETATPIDTAKAATGSK